MGMEWGDMSEGVPSPNPLPTLAPIPIAPGLVLRPYPDAVQRMLRSHNAYTRVEARTKAICDAANEMALREGAVYVYEVLDPEDRELARGRVLTGNEEACLDNLANSTLLKALGMYTDPESNP